VPWHTKHRVSLQDSLTGKQRIFSTFDQVCFWGGARFIVGVVFCQVIFNKLLNEFFIIEGRYNSPDHISIVLWRILTSYMMALPGLLLLSTGIRFASSFRLNRKMRFKEYNWLESVGYFEKDKTYAQEIEEIDEVVLARAQKLESSL